MNDYQTLIAKSRYAKWDSSTGKREDWGDTVYRYHSHFSKLVPVEHAAKFNEACTKVYEHEVMPSMRSLMTAGVALDTDNVAGFNCSYLAIDNVIAWDEAMYTLMCGTGVGFSCERQYINKLPTIFPPDESATILRDEVDNPSLQALLDGMDNQSLRKLYEPTKFYNVDWSSLSVLTEDNTIIVNDSKYGWASALRILLVELYNCNFDIKWDVSGVRPAGARLRTFGGRASGAEPLVDLFKFAVELFKGAEGRKLRSIEVHDLMCKVADIVVVGGVRRSALISLSNLSDMRMAKAKSGQWWADSGQRALANNSVCYTEKPDMAAFMKEWTSLYESKSGERGIFSREASEVQAAKNGRRETYKDFGTNPCLHPDSLVQTIHGEVKIKDITEPTYVYSMSEDGKLTIEKCSASWVSKKDAKTINITIASGKVVRCTPDHKIFIEGREWVEAQDVRIGDRVVHLSRNRRGAAYSGVKLTTQDRSETVMEHRLVWEAYYGHIPEGYDIHHIDGDTYNNDINNLECLSHSDHARITALEQPNNHMVTDYHGKGLTGYGFISPANSRQGKKVIIPMPESLKSGLHQYATVVSITEGETTDVYDLTVPTTHNFIADFVVVHNCSEIILRSKQFCY